MPNPHISIQGAHYVFTWNPDRYHEATQIRLIKGIELKGVDRKQSILSPPHKAEKRNAPHNPIKTYRNIKYEDGPIQDFNYIGMQVAGDVSFPLYNGSISGDTISGNTLDRLVNQSFREER